jgi:hypothetical protein
MTFGFRISNGCLLSFSCGTNFLYVRKVRHFDVAASRCGSGKRILNEGRSIGGCVSDADVTAMTTMYVGASLYREEPVYHAIIAHPVQKLKGNFTFAFQCF